MKEAIEMIKFVGLSKARSDFRSFVYNLLCTEDVQINVEARLNFEYKDRALQVIFYTVEYSDGLKINQFAIWHKGNYKLSSIEIYGKIISIAADTQRIAFSVTTEESVKKTFVLNK